MVKIKRSILAGCLALPLLLQASGLELFYDFEDAGAGTVQTPVRGDLFGSPRSSGLSTKDPAGSSDVAARLSGRSRKSLDTHGGFVWIRNGAVVDLGEEMTINFWCKSDTWKNARSTFIVHLGAWRLMYNPSKKLLEYQDLSDGVGEIISFDIDLSQSSDWNMLTFIKQGTSATLYQNSVKLGTQECAAGIPAGGGFYIGCASTSGRYGYDGMLDDFAVWSSALSDKQVNALYAGTSPMDVSALDLLKRTVTTALPEGLEAYFPPRQVELLKDGQPNAVIVDADVKAFDGTAEKLQRLLSESWGVTFPVMSWKDAQSTDKNLILFGSENASSPLRRLNANFMLGDNRLGYELRTLPDALDWKKGVLYIGGKTEAQVFDGAGRLVSRFADPAAIPFFVECQGWSQVPTDDELNAMVAEVEEKYSQFVSAKHNYVLSTMLKKPVMLYKMTGRDEYAATFAKMMKVFADNYESGKAARGGPPTFVFHQFPQYIYMVENSPAFTAEDRLLAAETIRHFVEEAMDFWEMREAKQLYRLAKQSYQQNHECFASRSVESSARYLLSRYNYEPAQYWKAVADNVFAGVAPHPFSPEDASGYQYLVYRIFVDYAIASGKYDKDFLKAEAFKEYIDEYAKPLVNHLGYNPGFGDAYPTYMRGCSFLLKQAVEVLDDKESEYILSMIERSDAGGYWGEEISTWNIQRDLPPPGEHTLGMHLVELRPFKQKQYQVWGLFNRPTLDKAVFRSGWDSHADYMSLTGINGGAHGHFDANSISQYISGNRLWLMEGDYIKKFPYNHNSMVISRDGEVVDQRRKIGLRNKDRASQIAAAVETPDRKLSLLSLLLENHNGVDWTRNICYAAANGFWVVDELDVEKDGRYVAQCYWRSLGRLEPHPGAVGFAQKASDDPAIADRFFIAEGTDSSRVMKSELEAGHGRKEGYVGGYPFAEKYTRYLIERQDGEYKSGDKLTFVNFLQAVPGGAVPTVRKLAPGVFLAESAGVLRLAVMGSFAAEGIAIDADLCFVGPEGVVARGAKLITVGAKAWDSSEAKDIALTYEAGLIKNALAGLKDSGEAVAATDPVNVLVPELSPSATVSMPSAVAEIAGCDGLTAAGDKNGLFAVFDSAGNKLFDHQFSRAISAIAPVDLPSGVCWAVAVCPEDLSVGNAELHFLDKSGGVLWSKTIETFHKRNGTVPVLLTARINGPDNPPAIIAGSEAWHYYAFSLEGEELWRAPIYHGATVAAAGDMNGDGEEDIAAGGEYYYHALLDSKGVAGRQETTSPFNYSVAVADFDDNGVDEAVFGRGDGYLYVMTFPENKYRKWNTNVGGQPVALAVLPASGTARLAAATDTGIVTFLDGAGRKVGVYYLPAPITDMKLWGDKLLVSALDGYVYVMDLNGQVQQKVRIQYDVNSIYWPQIAVSGKAAALSSDATIYLIK